MQMGSTEKALEEVAPYTGAWIEILCQLYSCIRALVAPYTGAWIEIGWFGNVWNAIIGRSLHGSVD